MGVETMITEAEIGDVRLKPLKNKHIKNDTKKSGNNSWKIS
jgi:hypothetical protein